MTTWPLAPIASHAFTSVPASSIALTVSRLPRLDTATIPDRTSRFGKPNYGIAVVARDPGRLDVFWIHPDGGVATTW